MGKITGKYETVFIVNPTLDEEATNAAVERFKSLIEENATDVDVDIWGKQRLAYPIQDLNEGYYVRVNFNAKPDFPAELDRIYGITDSIMRSMILCLDE